MMEFRNSPIIGKEKQSGSTLMLLIVALVIIAVLAAAIYTLTYTASSNQAVAQRATRAFYLSESGVRIAQSEYRTAVAAATANSVLPALHNKTFKLPDNVSSFNISVYPYWLYAKDPYTAGTSSITLYLPGDLPRRDDSDTAITFPTSGYLKVKDVRSTTTTVWGGITYVSYTNAVAGTFSAVYGTPVTFTLSSTFTDNIVAGDEFYIGYQTTQNATLSGNNLTLYVTDVNMAYMFPPGQGTMFVSKYPILYYKYDLRVIDSTVSPITVTLTNVQLLNGTAGTPTVLSGDFVYTGKSVGFRSTSTYGEQ